MRADVKLGLASSIVVILLAGWYFFDQDASQSTIPILEGGSDLTLGQPETRGEEITLPRESPPLDALAAAPAPQQSHPEPAGSKPVPHNWKPVPQTDEPDSPNVVDAEDDKPPGLADLFRTHGDSSVRDIANLGRQSSRPSARTEVVGSHRPDPLPVEEPIGVATFAPPASHPVADAVRMETHTVKPGDTMAELARRFYGNARYLQPLIDANPHIVDPTALAVGDVINLPDIDPIPLPHAEKKNTTAAGRTHTVTVGDTLYRIALNRLGEASRWKEIYELNKDLLGEDPGALKVGQVLKLPRR